MPKTSSSTRRRKRSKRTTSPPASPVSSCPARRREAAEQGGQPARIGLRIGLADIAAEPARPVEKAVHGQELHQLFQRRVVQPPVGDAPRQVERQQTGPGWRTGSRAPRRHGGAGPPAGPRSAARRLSAWCRRRTVRHPERSRPPSTSARRSRDPVWRYRAWRATPSGGGSGEGPAVASGGAGRQRAIGVRARIDPRTGAPGAAASGTGRIGRPVVGRATIAARVSLVNDPAQPRWVGARLETT